MGLIGCSFEGSQYSPEQVVQNALKEVTSPGAYYSESETIYRAKGEDTEHFISKEWHGNDGQIRIESASTTGEHKMIVVNNGTTVTMHDMDKNQAMIYEDDPESPSMTRPSLKEQANILLKMIEDTHTLAVEGEEKIADRASYHLVAKPKKENTLLGNMELWIDKENWMVLKIISKSGDSSLETVYTKIELDIDIPSEKFTLELPEDIDMLDLEMADNTTEITLAEAIENMAQPFLYFPEADGRKIDKIELSKLEGIVNRIELDIEYIKDDLPLLSLSVFEASEEIDDEETLMPGEESVTIRNQEGTSMEVGDFRIIYWQENGISYSVMPIDPNVSLEEVIEMTNEMELTR